MELIRPLDSLDRQDLQIAGGKGANLGAMRRAGLPVPPGFVVLTHAYRRFVAESGAWPRIEGLIGTIDAARQESVEHASVRIRALFAEACIPADLAEAIRAAYAELGAGAVAVRSSATAEDLPDASFAGQQETFLNVTGPELVLKAVQRCWSSLWTPRAISYRARAGIAMHDVALAVVVQRLVEADAAGVLFTADPVSGRRDRMVVDGAWGLGESVVSGLVSPDHWIVDGASGRILEEHIAAKAVMTFCTEGGVASRPAAPEFQTKPCLNPERVAALTDLGQRTARCFGAPQDMEWALAKDALHLLQSRPITTLFPLPEPLPAPESGLRIYATPQGMQGFLEPLTPAAISIFRTLVQGGVDRLRLGPVDVPSLITAAGGRIYVDVTGLLRTAPGRRVLGGGTIDAAVGRAVRELVAGSADRLGPARRRLRVPAARLPKGLLLRIAGRAIRALFDPDGARCIAKLRVEEYVHALDGESRIPKTTPERMDFVQTALASLLTGVIAQTVPLFVVGMLAESYVRRRIAAWGMDAALLDLVGRSIPHNPTSEMDLDLWRLSRELLLEGAEPSKDHPSVAALLSRYGHRTVREIDVGVPRWSEEPDHVLHLLRTYMAQESGATDPEHHFVQGAQLAERAIRTLTDEVRRQRGALSAAVIGLLLARFRRLAGVREWHKFYVVHVLAIVRRVLREVGSELVLEGRLATIDDVFFVHFEDLAIERDLRATAAAGRAAYARDQRRQPVPLAMTSEGQVSYGLPAREDGSISGLGASAGLFEGTVRVVLNPEGARLEPGEVLVAPGTDPAWTPLFLTAGALVTETGGMISHGSVVAREYGIPAVVGVARATTLLRDGQRVRVDGSAGTVVPLD